MYEVKVMPVNELKSPLNVILYVKKRPKTTFFKRFFAKKVPFRSNFFTEIFSTS